MNERKAGIVLSYSNTIVRILVGLAYVPLLLHFLTVEEFGLYQLIGSIGAYLSVLDFGLSGTIVRFYSQRLATDDRKSQENVLAISLIIYSVISIVVLCIGLVFYFSIDNLYGHNLSARELDSAKKMLMLIIVSTMIVIPAQVFKSAASAHEKFIVPRLATLAKDLTQPFIVLMVLRYKAEALSIVKINFIFDILLVAVSVWYALVRIGVKIHLHYFDKRLVASMFTFSFFLFITTIADRLFWKTGQLVLGNVASVAAVGVFAISIQLNSFYSQFSTAIVGVFLPKMSRLALAENGMEESNLFFQKAGRIQFILLGLIFTGFILYGKQFILLWAGEEFQQAYIICLVIMIPHTIDLIENSGIVICQARGKHIFRGIVYAIMGVVNILLSIFLAHRMGAIGCALSIALCKGVTDGLLMNYYYARHLGLHIGRFFTNIGRLALPMVVLFFIGYFIEYLLPIDSWLLLGSNILLFSLIFFVVMWFFGMNAYEKELVYSIATKLRRR